MAIAAISIGSIRLKATAPTPQANVENVYALDSDNFFYTCYGEDVDDCVFVCIGCGLILRQPHSNFGRVVGKCPVCQIVYPDTVKYDNIGGAIW